MDIHTHEKGKYAAFFVDIYFVSWRPNKASDYVIYSKDLQ